MTTNKHKSPCSDVTLIVPPSDSLNVVPPIGLGYIATELLKKGFSVEILDCLREKINLEESPKKSFPKFLFKTKNNFSTYKKY